MTEVVLYHHVQGLTEGVRIVAEELRQAGHTVHTPDLFDGRTFDTIEEGMAFAREAGFGALAERGVSAAEGLAQGRLRRLLLRSHGRPAARADPARRRWGLAHVFVPPGLGVRERLARGRPGAGAWQGRRPVLRRGTSRPRRPSSTRPTRPSCSSTRERSTCSPTPRFRRTTPPLRRCSPSACWRFSTRSRPTGKLKTFRPSGEASAVEPAGLAACAELLLLRHEVARRLPGTSRSA